MKDLLINLVSDALLNNHEINKTNVFVHFFTFWMNSREVQRSSCILEPHKKSRCLFILEANLHLGFITSLSVANIKCSSAQKPSPRYHRPSLSGKIQRCTSSISGLPQSPKVLRYLFNRGTRSNIDRCQD